MRSGTTTLHQQEQVSSSVHWIVQALESNDGGGPGSHRGLLYSEGGSTGGATEAMLESAAMNIVHELIDDAILNVVFEVHYSLKTGMLGLEVGETEEKDKFLQVISDGVDVFGQAPIKKQHECICPSCQRNLAASRFAPHLEKCMGMGRNSSRIASRRIQNATKENTNHQGGIGTDDDDDDDWIIDRKRRKRDKSSPRRTKTLKTKSEGVTSTSNNIESTFACGTIEEKKDLFGQICGVISEHTRKMCTRSLRCPQHTSDQRRAVRDRVLNRNELTSHAADSTSSNHGDIMRDECIADNQEDINIDIVDELDEGHLASSWDQDHSNTTSPADSTSTNNSNSSLAKRSLGKTKKKLFQSSSSKSSSSSHGSLLD